ncbi:MAG: 50S ribosomal protein L15 [Rhodothermales bacterium]
MDLSNLKPAKGATHSRKRIGRGQGSGHGGTSTRGHKGQKSRSGGGVPTWFEGGQMPLQRRIPKFGFKNHFRVEYQAVNLSRIASLVANGKLDANGITPASLVKAGAASKGDLIKILGSGDVDTALTVTAHRFSKSAKEKIEAAGGSATVAA